MNVLILTPDSVGSTFLQRTLTVYMQLCEFDRPVVNLHELTNGISKYYSNDFNQEILGKREDNWGYHQSLNEVVRLLSSVDHYKTSRLAHYHIKRRKDSIQEQVPFYDYLNQNFYIISCRRKNVFEHAVSRTLAKATGKLNVYSLAEKADTFLELYKNKIKLDQEALINTLGEYKDYLEWCDHFEIASYFNYETDVPNIENFILDLPFIANNKPKTFLDTFGITFNDWNKCHYYAGDIGSIALENKGNLQFTGDKFEPWESDSIKGYENIADENWPKVNNIKDFKNLPESIKQELTSVHNFDIEKIKDDKYSLSQKMCKDKLDFLYKNKTGYIDAINSMIKMQNLGIMISIPPMKKQTLAEKKFMIKNFDKCVNTYNTWQVSNKNIANPVDNNTIVEQNKIENCFWQTSQKLLK
jgi:hypothetical protein